MEIFCPNHYLHSFAGANPTRSTIKYLPNSHRFSDIYNIKVLIAMMRYLFLKNMERMLARDKAVSLTESKSFGR
ncbi:MAG: hypothetical protein ABSF36_07735 [Candidatus Methanomethylicaceae archaeon]